MCHICHECNELMCVLWQPLDGVACPDMLGTRWTAGLLMRSAVGEPMGSKHVHRVTTFSLGLAHIDRVESFSVLD